MSLIVLVHRKNAFIKRFSQINRSIRFNRDSRLVSQIYDKRILEFVQIISTLIFEFSKLIVFLQVNLVIFL